MKYLNKIKDSFLQFAQDLMNVKNSWIWILVWTVFWFMVGVING